MGIAEAKKYIQELHKKQDNPYLWPDYLTGLPDKSAILKKLDEILPKIGLYSIALVRIANIHPYLVKYGPSKHADIIQWAAAILKTTASQCKTSFVGALSTHDFIIICKTDSITKIINDANKLFQKRINTYYTKEDIQRKTTISFSSEGSLIHIGLMKFIWVFVDKKTKVSKGGELIHIMGMACEELESAR